MYFIMILLFAIIYLYIGPDHLMNVEKDSFTDSLYFASTVMSTAGLGDIYPKTRTARIIVTIQELMTIVLAGVIIIDF